MRKFWRSAFFQKLFLCHDLDVIVKPPPGMPDRADHFHFACARFWLFVLKTRWMPHFWTWFFVGDADALQSTSEMETELEQFICIRKSRRPFLLGSGDGLLTCLRRPEPRPAKSDACSSQPQARTILSGRANKPPVESSSGNVPGLSSEIHRTGLFHSAKQGRCGRRR